MLIDGYHDVPAGKLAAVVTHLEMRARAGLRPERGDAGWTLRRVETPSLAWYRALYRRVGEPWLWFSRLEMPDAELATVLTSPMVEVYALETAAGDEGILELDFRVAGECEIAFFGVAPSLVGSGAGRWLMNRAIARAWSQGITRLWLHTCSLDAPEALPFYVRSGFTPFARQVEVCDDPRVTGLLPRDAAPQVPLLSA